MPQFQGVLKRLIYKTNENLTRLYDVCKTILDPLDMTSSIADNTRYHHVVTFLHRTIHRSHFEVLCCLS